VLLSLDDADADEGTNADAKVLSLSNNIISLCWLMTFRSFRHVDSLYSVLYKRMYPYMLFRANHTMRNSCWILSRVRRIQPLTAHHHHHHHQYNTRHCLSTRNDGTRLITYLTDVEGDKAYLERYIRQSKILTMRDNHNHNNSHNNTASNSQHLHQHQPTILPYDWCIDFTDPDGELVFGGDLWDKGGHDLFCVRQLLDLKRRYPQRVHFILGNRDLNKLRILNELGSDDGLTNPTRTTMVMPRHHGVYYLTGTGRPGDPMLPNAGISQTCPVERLKWMLADTMGSPQAFEFRKQELELEREERLARTTTGQAGWSSDIITDAHVVQSYRRACHPNGEMGQYLRQGHLALKLGSLFVVHGALPLTPEVLESAEEEESSSSSSVWSNMEFAMPWRDVAQIKEPVPSNVIDWIQSTNSFADLELRKWADCIAELERSGQSGQSDQPIWAERGGYHDAGTPYCNLMQYGYGWTPNGKRNRTVVYSSWQTRGMPRRFARDAATKFAKMTSEFFDEAHVQLILSGHQPSGDMPTPIRVDANKMIVCCDTSYSGDTMWEDVARINPGRGSSGSGRGNLAVSEVLVEQCKLSGEIRDVTLHGVLSDGSKYEMKNVMSDACVGLAATIGKSTLSPSSASSPSTRDWWVKAKLGANGPFLLSSAEGYDVWNRIVADDSMTTDSILRLGGARS
jgi:hypothetical protein